MMWGGVIDRADEALDTTAAWLKAKV